MKFLRVLAALLLIALAAGCAGRQGAASPTTAPQATPIPTATTVSMAATSTATAAPTAAPSPTTASKPAPSGEPVRIGVLTPLSPPGDAAAGQLIVRGAELGVKYVNEVMGGVLDGRPIEIVVEDDQGTPEQGVAGYRRLVDEKRVVAVVGQFHSAVNLAVNEIAKDVGVPVFSTQASAKDITAKHYPIAFRTHLIDPIRVEGWLDFIQQQGYTRVALVAEDTDYGIGLIEETKRQIKERGLQVELREFVVDRRSTDLTPQLLQVRDFKPDLVINVAVGQLAYLMVQQAYDIGLFPDTPMLASYDFPVRPEFWKNLGEKGNGLYFIAYYHPRQSLTPIGEWFVKAYEQAYNEPPVYSALSAFGGIVVLAQALNQAGKADPQALIAALENGTFESWYGKVTFPRAEGPYWHQATPSLLILHYTEPQQDWRQAEVVYEYQPSR